MATLSPVTLGITTASSFAVVLAFRPFFYNYFVFTAHKATRLKKAFLTELFLCLLAGLLLFTYNRIAYGFPLYSITSLMIGCFIAGFFIGLDAALNQERLMILEAMEQDDPDPLPQRLFSMTRKFTFITVAITFFVSLVMILVFTKDIVWLTKIAQDDTSIHGAQLSVAIEIFFIMAVLMVLIINLIFAYSKNMQLLFKNETRILEQVSDGNLTQKVPIATQDEFGVIAGHTNNMIDGLRHRFELISAMKLAEEIQQNLLPDHNPEIEGLDISGTSLYCDETGGDYYDYFQLTENRFGIVVADVCGHGMGAAILMTSVRAFLHMAVASYQSPAELLNTINRYITRDCARSGRFTTMFFLEFAPVERSLRWVRAGHEPALYFDSVSQTFNLLDGPGLVLGVDEQHQYQESNRTGITANDIILIGTDGIGESRNANDEMFGQNRVENTILKNASESAEVIQKAIIKEVTAFRGEIPQEDDITLVVVKVI